MRLEPFVLRRIDCGRRHDMGLIEKTVFICYRRKKVPWALAVSADAPGAGDSRRSCS